MTKNELHLRIISPSSTIYDDMVSMVVMPGAEGVFAVLPNHMPLIASLKEGNIQIYKGGAISSEQLITLGIASISNDGVDILLSK